MLTFGQNRFKPNTGSLNTQDIKFIKTKLPIGLIWLFHVSGLIGIFSGMSQWFLEQTPLNLLACFLLLLLAWPLKDLKHGIVVYAFFMAGIFAEWMGIHYGFPFGDYHYGENLGLKIDGVPYMIGINWAMLVLITGSISSKITRITLFKVLIGASLMVFLDLFIEPNAARLDFWYWEKNQIPLSNYIGWFVISALLHWLFQETIKELNFAFSLNLYIAQLIFFIALYVQSLF